MITCRSKIQNGHKVKPELGNEALKMGIWDPLPPQSPRGYNNIASEIKHGHIKVDLKTGQNDSEHCQSVSYCDGASNR